MKESLKNQEKPDGIDEAYKTILQNYLKIYPELNDKVKPPQMNTENKSTSPKVTDVSSSLHNRIHASNKNDKHKPKIMNDLKKTNKVLISFSKSTGNISIRIYLAMYIKRALNTSLCYFSCSKPGLFKKCK